MDLSVTLGEYQLSSPLIAASGTVGSVVDFQEVVDFSFYGAATAKSVADEPWPGRRPPRLAPVDAGMLNSIGIQNDGIDQWNRTVAPRIPTVPTEFWGSVVAHDIDGFASVASSISDSGVKAVEVNLSCPNLDGAPFALDPALSAAVIRSVRSATHLPISAKLSSDAQPISDVAAAVAEAGADWVVVSNTVMGARIDPETRRPALSGLIGGYSGSPIRPIAVRSVLEIARDLPGLPIVACGGASEAAHVVEFLLAGASAVAIGSAHFRAPRVATSITKQLNRYMAKHGVARISQLTGAYEPW
jgi:dihydroorotate dehydrogenase (NAD+) catalytic subunit